jgi:transcriptional regulator with XRE-family HTH domain
MFLGTRIYERRRQQGLTQTELAHQICTQNTISKLEKHNVAPTVNILIKLCERLNLTLNDVFDDFDANTSSEEHQLLTNLETQLLLQEATPETLATFKLLRPADMQPADHLQYALVKSMLELQQGQLDDAQFTLDQVLQLTKNDATNVDTVLAYILKGESYAEKHAERIDYYMQLATHAVKEKVSLPAATLVEQLFICQALAAYHYHQQALKVALHYCQQGLKLAQVHHSTMFMGPLSRVYVDLLRDDPAKRTTFENYQKIVTLLAEVEI